MSSKFDSQASEHIQSNFIPIFIPASSFLFDSARAFVSRRLHPIKRKVQPLSICF
ncbi:hypothetical protein Hanom_Chr03g00261711 [Helianthus anomalus]